MTGWAVVSEKVDQGWPAGRREQESGRASQAEGSDQPCRSAVAIGSDKQGMTSKRPHWTHSGGTLSGLASLHIKPLRKPLKPSTMPTTERPEGTGFGNYRARWMYQLTRPCSVGPHSWIASTFQRGIQMACQRGCHTIIFLRKMRPKAIEAAEVILAWCQGFIPRG